MTTKEFFINFISCLMILLYGAFGYLMNVLFAYGVIHLLTHTTGTSYMYLNPWGIGAVISIVFGTVAVVFFHLRAAHD